MQLVKPLAIAAALVALHGVASAATYSAIPGLGTVETTSVVNQYLAPLAPVGSTVSSFSVLSTASGFSSSATLSFAAPVTSYTFLWGSPDAFNSVTDGLVTVTGAAFSTGTGNNAESKEYTFVDMAGFSSLTFKTTGIAFELAVSPVPEPETYALLLGGLGAVFTIARRRKS